MSPCEAQQAWLLFTLAFAVVVTTCLLLLRSCWKDCRVPPRTSTTSAEGFYEPYNLSSESLDVLARGPHFFKVRRKDEERDEVKLGAIRPWQDGVDGGKKKESEDDDEDEDEDKHEGEEKRISDLSYHIEMKPAEFMSIMKRVQDLKHSEYSKGEEMVLNVADMPKHTTFLLREHFTRVVNAAGKENLRGGPPFMVTMVHLHGAKGNFPTGMTRVEATLCFHRSGKSVGHCVRADCFIDKDGERVKVGRCRHVGVLPEYMAQRRALL